MAVQKQGSQLKLAYSSSVRILGVVQGTYRKRWTIGMGGERESGISELMARQDDDEINDWYLIEQLVVHSNIGNYLTLLAKLIP